jgi:hypothetical protein
MDVSLVVEMNLEALLFLVVDGHSIAAFFRPRRCSIGSDMITAQRLDSEVHVHHIHICGFLGIIDIHCIKPVLDEEVISGKHVNGDIHRIGIWRHNFSSSHKCIGDSCKGVNVSSSALSCFLKALVYLLNIDVKELKL